jgi:hypothetical protein
VAAALGDCGGATNLFGKVARSVAKTTEDREEYQRLSLPYFVRCGDPFRTSAEKPRFVSISPFVCSLAYNRNLFPKSEIAR